MLAPAILADLPERLGASQRVFRRPGGLHGPGLFDAAGNPCGAREDVGRHNAVDKVGEAFLRGGLPLRDRVLVVSGRASFELVQKAVAAGAVALVAVGAPSSLAGDVAARFGLTLVGFAREGALLLGGGSRRYGSPKWMAEVGGVPMGLVDAPALGVLLGAGGADRPVVPEGERGPEPLCALYPTRLLGPVWSAIAGGRLSLRALLEEAGVRRLTMAELREASRRPDVLLNVNRPGLSEGAEAVLRAEEAGTAGSASKRGAGRPDSRHPAPGRRR